MCYRSPFRKLSAKRDNFEAFLLVILLCFVSREDFLIKKSFYEEVNRAISRQQLHCFFPLPLSLSLASSWMKCFTYPMKNLLWKLKWLTMRHLCARHIRAARICFNAQQFQLTFIALLGLSAFDYCDCAQDFPLFAALIVEHSEIMHAMIMNSSYGRFRFLRKILFICERLFHTLLMILSFIHNHHSQLHSPNSFVMNSKWFRYAQFLTSDFYEFNPAPSLTIHNLSRVSRLLAQE